MATCSTLERLVLPRLVWQQLCGHALREWPRECLGMLVGLAEGRVRAAYEIANAASDPHRFWSEPASLLAAEKRRRQEGWHLLGFYHSHPGGQPVPSRIDTDPEVNFWLDGSVVSLIIALRPVQTASSASQSSTGSAIAPSALARSEHPQAAKHATSSTLGLTETVSEFCLEARAYRLYPGRWEAVPLDVEE